MLGKNYKSIGIGLFVAAAWAVCGGSGTAFAATRTWVGTDCPSTNCNWSNVNNWQGGVAPVNGDDIVIHATTTDPGAFDGTFNDIPNLTVNSIDVSGYADSANDSVVIMNGLSNNTPLTIAGNITYTAPSTAAPSGWYPAYWLTLTHGTIILGANSVFTEVRLDPNDTLNLNGHALTYTRTVADGGASGTTVNFSPVITGNGTLNINVPTTAALFMKGVNTYSGTTNINSVDYIDSSDANNVQTFGSSVVNLSGQGRILFSADGAQTISNVINVTPPAITGTFLADQLLFWSHSAAVTYTVPNIHLLGNARFGTNTSSGSVLVNLAGITTNGHCVQYGTDNNDAADFQNGPSACVVAVASTPNTGFALLNASPLLTLMGTVVASGALLVLGKKILSKR